LRIIVENVAIAMGATAEVSIEAGYDSLWNHPAETNIVRAAAGSVLGADHVVEINPVMPVEDFTYYTQVKPGAYFFVGAKMDYHALVYPHHHENFDFNENAMLVTAKVFAAIYFKAQETASDSISVDLDSI